MPPEDTTIAVIFCSLLRAEDPEYLATAERMETLARTIPGFVGFETARSGLQGISISYWASEEAIANWRQHPEHLEAQARGKKDWYERYSLRVARITRSYEFSRAEDD